MTTGYWLRIATQFLQSKAITTARLDALVLLEDTLRTNRATLLAEPDTKMSDAQVDHLQKLLSRRSKHEPLAYIRGHSEFYGRNFVITPAVLEPRPESETMIDLLKDVCTGSHPSKNRDPNKKNIDEIPKLVPDNVAVWKISDVGTGSGALGITAALEVPKSQVELLEVDSAALKIAKTNVDLFTLGIRVTQSDLLAAATMKPDILLCNLPYVPDDYTINKAARHEPSVALFGGPDGLDVYRKLLDQIDNAKHKPLYVFTEAFSEQHKALRTLFAAHGYTLDKTDDFIQQFSLSD